MISSRMGLKLILKYLKILRKLYSTVDLPLLMSIFVHNSFQEAIADAEKKIDEMFWNRKLLWSRQEEMDLAKYIEGKDPSKFTDDEWKELQKLVGWPRVAIESRIPKVHEAVKNAMQVEETLYSKLMTEYNRRINEKLKWD